MNTPTPPRGRHPKQVLAVRALAAKVAWLDAPPAWNEGGVAWMLAAGPFRPGPSDLARAQQTLNRIGQYPYSAELALKDRRAWLRVRQQRLKTAKLLTAVPAGEMADLCRQVRAPGRPAEAIEQLAALLCVEALCAGPLPDSPAMALAACGRAADHALRAAADDGSLPPEVRALATLALGGAGIAASPCRTGEDGDWIRRAFRWGQAHGVPTAAGLVAALLREEAGEKRARRLLAALPRQSEFALTERQIRALIHTGVAEERLVEAVESLAEMAPLAERILRTDRDLPPRRTPAERRKRAEEIAESRRKALSLLNRLVGRCAVECGPEGPRRIGIIVERLLSRFQNVEPVLDVVTSVLAEARELPPESALELLRILDEELDTLWGHEGYTFSRKPHVRARQVADSLKQQWAHGGRALLGLLQKRVGSATARGAVRSGLLSALAGHDWHDPALYRMALALEAEFPCGRSAHAFERLCLLLDAFKTASEARSALAPLFDSVRSVPQDVRVSLLYGVLDSRWWSKREVRTSLTAYGSAIGPLSRYLAASSSGDAMDTLAALYHVLWSESRDSAARRLHDVVDLFLASEAGAAVKVGEEAAGFAARVACVLAGEDDAAFLRLFRTTAARKPEYPIWRFDPSLAVLRRHPWLRAALAAGWERAPDRCAALLSRAALAMRLGEEAAGGLAALDRADSRDDSVGEGWRRLEEAAPDCGLLLAELRRNLALVGTDEPPRGLCRIAGRRETMETETASLAARLAEDPANLDLAGRLRVLRERLGDGERLAREAAAELEKKLDHAVRESALAAAELVVDGCYRARLERIAGPLPPDLRIDGDLMNAALLSVDISQNRKLLARIIRGRLSGDQGWIRSHPANVAFLDSLDRAGIDPKEWVKANPRRYPLAAVEGGAVHLRVEQDPIRVLQMGNYFDTCLSFGGCNSFSTIANACEMNKRVIFARDRAGRVIGRKLIAMNEKMGLVGYHTYTALPGDEGGGALRAIFRRYCEGFAARCGIRMESAGEVPRLFAEEWYDDGAVEWGSAGGRAAGKADGPPELANRGGVPQPVS